VVIWFDETFNDLEIDFALVCDAIDLTNKSNLLDLENHLLRQSALQESFYTAQDKTLQYAQVNL
jgi:hypothetical protein